MNIIKSIVILTAVTTSLIAPLNSVTKSAVAQTGSLRQFHCGKAGDPSSKSNLPATIFGVPNTEGTVIIIWKSEFFSKFTPEQRCQIVSPKFQSAIIQEGRLFLTSGGDKQTGLGLICALKDRDQVCDRSTMLFTLKSYQSADQTIADLSNIVTGRTTNPLYQNSGGKTVIDLGVLLKQ
jgi:hypothetical protein